MDAQAFLSAISSGDRAAVAQALRDDPTIANVRGASGASAIQWALYHGHADLADDMVAAGAEIDLATASSIGKIDAIPVDADVNALSQDGFRPLALAVAFGHNEVARLLLQKGADPNLPSTALGGVPPLQSAVFGRNLEGVRMLVEAGADVNATQSGGFTAIMGAAQNGDLEMVRYLLDHGADAGARNDDGKGPADLTTSEEIRIGFINGF